MDICCGCLKEPSLETTLEYSQHMFLFINKKIIFVFYNLI